MDFYLATLRFLTDLAVNAKSCLNSNLVSEEKKDAKEKMWAVLFDLSIL